MSGNLSVVEKIDQHALLRFLIDAMIRDTPIPQALVPRTCRPDRPTVFPRPRPDCTGVAVQLF